MNQGKQLGGRGHRPGATTSGVKPQLDEPTYVPRSADAGAQLRARIHRKADQQHGAPKRDGIERVPQKGDDGHEYKYDQMHPGPLSDENKYPSKSDPKTGKQKKTKPATGFFGGKYDEEVLKQPLTLHRIAKDVKNRLVGEWWTEQPLESEAKLRMDAAVRRNADADRRRRRGRAGRGSTIR